MPRQAKENGRRDTRTLTVAEAHTSDVGRRIARVDPKVAEDHTKELKVQWRHIEEAMKKVRPLSQQELDWYKRVAEQFGKPRLPSEVSRGVL
jgi:hypothetical protein